MSTNHGPAHLLDTPALDLGARPAEPRTDLAHWISGVHASLLPWFAGSARDLPWRGDARDPYAVWVSEVMLQQTQVRRAMPYFRRWMARFPTLADLARASIDDVLRTWAGLGYYARARSLHAAAIAITAGGSAAVPDDLPSLLDLPGVGQYTAAAILTFAHGRREPAVDTNVLRVVARCLSLQGSTASPELRRDVVDAVHAAMYDRAADVNEALMELGATKCSAWDPACSTCPLCSACKAAGHGDPSGVPMRPKGRGTVRVTQACALIEHESQVLMVRRPLHGLWGGLWEMPRSVCTPGAGLDECAASAAASVSGVTPEHMTCLGTISHSVTHHAITLHVFRATRPDWPVVPIDECGAWVDADRMSRLAVAAPQASALRLGGWVAAASEDCL